MPVDVGSAVGSVKLDVRPVGEAVQKVNRLLDGLASGSKKSFSTAGDAADKGFSKVNKGAEAAEKALGRFNGVLGKISPAAFIGLGVGVSAAFGMAVKSAFEMNATLETTELQFETLMGSADAAQKHVADLFEFAKKTPFETGPIIEASRMMRTFGGDALDTKANLTLVGDAAAATNAPINELGFWVGRLYSNLQGGQPFGEAAMRLQELAVLSPKARQEMEALQKAGGTAAEVFAVFQGDLGKFSGAMEKQASTWSGLVSTIKDSLQLALAEGFEPFFEGAKEGLSTIVDLFNSPEFDAGVKAFATRLGELTAVIIPLAIEHGPALIKMVLGLTAAFTGLVVTAKVAGSIATIIKVATGLSAALSGTAAATAAAGEAAAVAAGGTGLLSGALTLLTGPVGLIIAAVGLLAVAWAKDWGGIREKTAAAVDAIKSKVSEGLKAVQSFWDKHGQGVEKAAGHLWAAVKTRFDVGVKNARSVTEAFGAALQGDWYTVGVKLREAAERWMQGVRDVFGHLKEAVGPGLEALGRHVATWWNGIDWEHLGENAADGLSRGLRGLVDKLDAMDAAGAEAVRQFKAGWAAGDQEGTTDAWLEKALLEQAEALAKAQASAAGADEALLNFYRTEVKIERQTIDTSRKLSSYWATVVATGEHSKLAADRTNHFAAGLEALTQKAMGVKRALDDAAVAQEAYNNYLVDAQGDYAHDLPGSDKPLVTPAHAVSTTTGGLTPEQKELLSDYGSEVEKLEAKLFDLTHGIGTYGEEQDKVNQQIADAQGEIEHYRKLMGPLEGVTGEVSTSQKGLAVNVSAVHQAIYEQLLALPNAADAALAFAGATGIMSQAEMEAALQAAAIKEKIDALAVKIAEGMPIDQALADLDAFIDKIENGVDPATVTLADTVPQRVMDMKDAMAENGMTAGQAVPESIADGINDTLITAETAAEDAATAIIDIMRTTFGVESPSTVLSEIGGNLMLGLDEGMDGEADTVTGTAERIGQAIIKAFDETIGKAPAVGKAIIDGIVAGVEANRGSLIEKMKEIAKAAYAAAMTELDAHSPSRVFMTVGDAIIAGIIEGLDRSEDELYDKLQSVAETLHGIAEGVFNLQSDALQLDIEAADSDLLKALTDMRWKYLLTPEQLDTLSNADPTQLPYILRQLKQDPNFQTEAAAAALEEAIQLADQRNALEQEYIHQQEELKALEQARQQLDFLGYQVELLNLIKDNSLDASILDGLELGLDANMSDIIAAMTAAVQELITKTEEELGIASPSKVFRDIGQNIMRGMALGIADHKSLDAVLRERLLSAQQVGVSLNPQQTIYIFGGYNPTVGRQTAAADPLRDLYYQSL